MTLHKKLLYLHGKPNERLIAIACCNKFNCPFSYSESSGLLTFVSAHKSRVDDAYDATKAIIGIAYKSMAFAQADHRFDDVPVKTLNSEFMQAYAAIAHSLITGTPFNFVATTDAHRAGLKAGGTVG